MNDLDELVHQIARAAIMLKIDEDNLGRQMIRESIGLDNWAKRAYSNRRKSRMELEAATTQYMEALLKNIGELSTKPG